MPRYCAVVLLAGLWLAPVAAEQAPDPRLFFQAASTDRKAAREALEQIAAAGWRDGYAALIVDLARFLPAPGQRVSAVDGALVGEAGSGRPGPSGAAVDFGQRVGRQRTPKSDARDRLIRFLAKQTRQRFGQDLRRWRKWIWSRPYEPHPRYAEFKATLYAAVDKRMAAFFPAGVRSSVRLDEIDWGGVGVNGIPPLEQPAVVSAREATYLDADDVVFGVFVNGKARAYPKRILGWHELALDRLGGVDLTVVYCTLCGTVVPYASQVAGRTLTFGTSGLLYRSNKLMFDHETASLWSSTEGRPVVGPLVGQGLELRAHPAVTTTWKAWSSAHPDTTVLSLETGFKRDYSEGAAYRSYFATDRLMFEVPGRDKRLKNKDEVLALLLQPMDDEGAERRALALAVKFLRKHPLHQQSFAGHELVVVTGHAGANRVYEVGDQRFVRQEPEGVLHDAEGGRWRVTEDALVPARAGVSPLPRVAARRAFWFGWQAQFPETVLVQ